MLIVKRFGALIIDLLIWFICIMLMGFLIVFLLVAIAGEESLYSDSYEEILPMILGIFALSLWQIRDMFSFTSLGKRALGLRVIDSSVSEIKPASKKQLFIRNLFTFIIQIDCTFPIAYYFTRDINVRIADLAAKTEVIETHKLEHI